MLSRLRRPSLPEDLWTSWGLQAHEDLHALLTESMEKLAARTFLMKLPSWPSLFISKEEKDW
jgi:hypothetical protein